MIDASTQDASPQQAPQAGVDLRYIYRRPKRNLWSVEIVRQRKRVARQFCDGTYGGTQTALAAAVAFRDMALANAVPYTKSEFASKLKSHNTSSVTGVLRSESTRKTATGTVITIVQWIATYQGVRAKQKRTRSFSVFKYGEQGAYELAVKARAQLLTEFALDEQAYLPRVPKGDPIAVPQSDTSSE